ncbi:nickel ABC transporter substrate-binding protein [Desulfogranum japonicum]|uniref:nickel ABC transporter substrate-binding protein n=1 Tax=Desulfogranum japonicum TaxID=231447 RepID=UPI000428B390|nr:nickel ABC transporter substrate-binding protein [Desulfogranum japonicum]
MHTCFNFKVIAVALVATLFCSCISPAMANDDDTLVYSWGANVGELNPHMYSPNQMFAQAMVYEPLVKYGEGNLVMPWLAKAWTISEDGKVYTFTLREDVIFTDGTPCNAEAVKKNFEAVLLNRARHKWLELVAQIDKVEALDEFTFRLTLKHAYYPTLQELCLIRPLRFMSPAAMPEDGNTAKGIIQPVGTGPWKLMETRKGEYDLFERNDRYWGQKPAFSKLLVKVISDPVARAIAMETDEIDLIHGTAGHGSGQISFDAFERFTKMPDYVTKISPPLASRIIAINSNRGPTAELPVRLAIEHAVNKAALVKAIFYGVEEKADTLYPADTPYCDLGLTPFTYDPALAEKLLAEAGWKQDAPGEIRTKNGKELVIDFCFVGNDAQQKAVAEAIQGDLWKVGIRIHMIGEEPDSNINRQKTGEFGMVFNETWGAPYDPHSFCSSMRAPSHADYQAQLGLPMKEKIDAKISEVLLSTDEGQRRELYRYILTTLHEQAVYLPLTYIRGVIVHKKDLKGVKYGQLKAEIPFELIEKKR